jgi:hypothetical protein
MLKRGKTFRTSPDRFADMGIITVIVGTTDAETAELAAPASFEDI